MKAIIWKKIFFIFNENILIEKEKIEKMWLEYVYIDSNTLGLEYIKDITEEEYYSPSEDTIYLHNSEKWMQFWGLWYIS